MLEAFLIKLQALRTAKYLRTPYFTERLQWLYLTVSDFQPATLLKKGLLKNVFL